MTQLVTLFGGGGFLGRYLARELMKTGTRVRFAARRPERAWFLKPQGGLGQTQFVAADVRRPETVERALLGADAAVNLVGVLKGDFDAYHVDGACNVAEAAARLGVKALVQISALGADPAGTSRYQRSKGEGEAAVRAAFPAATILRPSVLFGPEDGFVNLFAKLARVAPFLPVIRPQAKLQPAWVADVARAAAQAVLDPARHGGHTYSLGGPQVLTMAELNRMILGWIGRDSRVWEVPDALSQGLVSMTGWLPGAPVTADRFQTLGQDNVVPAGAEGFAAFGIEPTPLGAVAPGWLVQYRRHGRFGLNQAAR
ncbi:complex I NDUFA9 subunit family protein [Sphingomonas jatrophae]|uniref:NADH dehydrogenase n=1 Tax=Sphingomonas jatrophae TaxID=1166337 RepID=A0A1I6L2W3_9SPHN|nr:complex I NDUFA9 subunit family protein [Sphingomonas jatrophae]SFR97786.1 NADH dehydrogenase [Sphingomonas jatrophae]